MSFTVQKGNSFSGKYTSDTIALAADWEGTVNVYSTYPGNAIFAVDLTLTDDTLTFTLSAGDILNLSSGTYTIVGQLISASLGVDAFKIDYLAVGDIVVSDNPMTLLTMTILKADGTPAGEQTQRLVNTVNGTVVQAGWNGVKVTLSHATSYNIGTDIIGTEKMVIETDSSGYAQTSVIKGSVVTATCPAFGKTVTIDTTGLDTVDLSAYF